MSKIARRCLIVGGLLVLTWSNSPISVVAATCGAGTQSKPAIGTLNPLVEGSTTELHYPGDENSSLFLIFEVRDCLLGPLYAQSLAVEYDFASLQQAAFERTVKATATRATWRITVDPDMVPYGVHKGIIVIGGNESTVKRVTIPVVITKSESQFVALAVAALAWLIGVVGAFFGASSVRNWQRGLAGAIVALAPVLAILKAQYWDVQGWTGLQAELLLFVGAVAAAYGAAKVIMLDRSTE